MFPMVIQIVHIVRDLQCISAWLARSNKKKNNHVGTVKSEATSRTPNINLRFNRKLFIGSINYNIGAISGCHRPNQSTLSIKLHTIEINKKMRACGRATESEGNANATPHTQTKITRTATTRAVAAVGEAGAAHMVCAKPFVNGT